jgi:hypothetical protein
MKYLIYRAQINNSNSTIRAQIAIKFMWLYVHSNKAVCRLKIQFMAQTPKQMNGKWAFTNKRQKSPAKFRTLLSQRKNEANAESVSTQRFSLHRSLTLRHSRF